MFFKDTTCGLAVAVATVSSDNQHCRLLCFHFPLLVSHKAPQPELLNGSILYVRHTFGQSCTSTHTLTYTSQGLTMGSAVNYMSRSAAAHPCWVSMHCWWHSDSECMKLEIQYSDVMLHSKYHWMLLVESTAMVETKCYHTGRHVCLNVCLSNCVPLFAC